MATYNNKPASVGLSDPKLVRQTETALAQASLIARGKPTVTSAGELILPNTTLAVGANSVSTTTSANNSPADVVTVYSGQGAIYASSIDQTVNQTIVNQVGVSSIVAGNNITITSTGTSEGTGIVTVNAVLDGNNAPGGSNTQIQFNDAGVFGGNAGFTFNKTTGVLAAPFFSGPGNSLSNIQGTNVTGAVAFAGTANSVALANVSGAGNIASINLTGSTSNVLYGNGVFAAVASGYGDSNVATFLASYGSNTMTTTGNVSVGNIIGNGQALTNIAGANVSGFVPNANVANTAFAVAAANVSGLGNIATINLDGNASNVLFGNGTFRAFTAFSSNINGTGFNLGNVGNLGVTGAISTTGNVTGGNVTTGGALSVTGNANIGNIGTGGLITATGNITGGNITTAGVLKISSALSYIDVAGTGFIQNGGTGEFQLSTANATQPLKISTNSASKNWFFYANGDMTAPGAFSATGNAIVGNISATNLGNISATNLDGNSSNILYGNGVFAAVAGGYGNSNVATFLASYGSNTMTTTGNVSVGNIIGNGQALTGLAGANVSGQVGNALVASTVYTNAQPNITSVGTLTSVSVSGNANVGNIGTGGLITATGNITGANISTAGNISGNTNGFAIGYLNIPQVSASNATLGLTDAGKHYYSTTAGNFTLTIPNNATTSFATGTAISIVVQAAGNILANADTGVTLYMAGNSTAANRVVGGYGMATLMKVATDTWFINGTGVS
jgi:hypothetical protein